MSYTRGDWYCWSDGDCMHIWGPPAGAEDRPKVAVPTALFDQLVAMRWAEMTERQRRSASRRAVANWRGNVGCWELARQVDEAVG